MIDVKLSGVPGFTTKIKVSGRFAVLTITLIIPDLTSTLISNDNGLPHLNSKALKQRGGSKSN